MLHIQEMDEELDRQNLSLDRINLKADANIRSGKRSRKKLSDSPSPPPSLQVAVADVSALY